MGAAALELGQPEGGAVPRLRKRLDTDSPETLVTEGLRPGPTRSPPQQNTPRRGPWQWWGQFS